MGSFFFINDLDTLLQGNREQYSVVWARWSHKTEPISLLPTGWTPHSHLMGSMGWGSGAGLLWYILMMFPISWLGAGRESGPEGFTTGGPLFTFGVSFFGFGSGGGRVEAGAVRVTAFISRPAKTQEKSLYLI